MKLLVGSVEELFKVLPEEHPLVFWETLSKTRYTGSIPHTRCVIQVTAVVVVSGQHAIAEVTIPCGSYTGEPHDNIDPPQKEKVIQYHREIEREIKKLAEAFGVQLCDGILTLDAQESLYGMVRAPKEKED